MTKIILLNGVSSSGKTTIGKLLQARLNDPEWLFLSIDDALEKLPKQAFETREKFSRNVLKMIPAFHRSIAAYAGNDVPTIVDHVFQEAGWFEDFVKATSGIKSLKVGVKCPLEVLEARERARGDRESGLVKMQFTKVHNNITYNVEVDTSTMTPEECVTQILGKLHNI